MNGQFGGHEGSVPYAFAYTIGRDSQGQGKTDLDECPWKYDAIPQETNAGGLRRTYVRRKPLPPLSSPNKLKYLDNLARIIFRHTHRASRSGVNLDTFPAVPYRPTMPDTPDLRPATRDELTQSLSFALRFSGRKRVHDADEMMAQITAERLVEHLERSGYVVTHKAPLGQHGAPGNLAGWIE